MDWRPRYYHMLTVFAESAWRAYMLNPGLQLYWYYQEASGQDWGRFLWDTDNPTERRQDGPWILATPDMIPRHFTLSQVWTWLADRAGRLPIIGG